MAEAQSSSALAAVAFEGSDLASLLQKPDRERVKVPIDYLGFRVPDRFVVGYGLDFDSKWRNLPYLGVLSGR